ncbi:MAG TPA: rhodanese-like domain-containing protein [Burkholderiales bacterium]|nr:rhodanese-like domain-containing protein [Burkholderiales bacterium]
MAKEHDAVHALNYNRRLMLDFLQKNILLVAAAVGSGAMLLWPLVRGAAGGASVSLLEATQLINRQDALVLDVREAAQYAEGHILGARSLPIADLARRAGELEKFKNRPLIVACDSGNTSQRAVRELRARGFANAVSLSGGFRAWLQGGLPMEK